MDKAFAWQQMFENWPKSFEKRGLVVAEHLEPIEFTDFMTSDGLLALERLRPDSSGARKVVVAFTAIVAVKLQDINPISTMSQLGFVRQE